MSSDSQPIFFLPTIWEEISDTTNFYGWDFLRPLIGRRIFWASVVWGDYNNKDLPSGYAGYVVKTEGPNVEWIERQAQLVEAPIFFCCLYKDYGAFDHLPNVHFVPTIEWHYQLVTLSKMYGDQIDKNIQYKVSALCSRATQSKIVALAALAQHVGLENCLVSLHSIEERDVHHWQSSNNVTVDQYTKYFIENFKDKTILIDQFTILDSNKFHNPAYLNSAMNINNESFHYSYTNYKGKKRINPGPFITEKTLKCLLTETAFINNGQFDTYNTLSSLGFKFDYGLDLKYDKDPRNLSRLEGMLGVIKHLAEYTTQDLYQQTRDACLHNKHHVMSGEFFSIAEAINNRATETILSQL